MDLCSRLSSIGFTKSRLCVGSVKFGFVLGLAVTVLFSCVESCLLGQNFEQDLMIFVMETVRNRILRVHLL